MPKYFSPHSIARLQKSSRPSAPLPPFSLKMSDTFGGIGERSTLEIFQNQVRLRGFILVQMIPPTLRCALVDPEITNSPLQRIEITGVNHGGRKGSTKFSSIDLFGKKYTREVYLVSDLLKFNSFLATRFQRMFFECNPDPDRGIRKAFTQFLHNYGLHWSGCSHLRTSFDRR